MTSIKHTAIVGGGYMGGGIAQTLAVNGIDCLLADASSDLADKSVRRLHEETEQYESLGLFPEGASSSVAEHLRAAPRLEDAVVEADFITEAVPEILALKQAVLSAISQAARPDAIISSNTSALSISELACHVSHAERFLGVHWMNPAFFVPGVEVIPTADTAPEVVTTVTELLRRAGKTPTEVADSPGFVANRLQYSLFKECARLVEEGIATPEQIDEVVSNSFGFRLPFFGPFAIADIAGLDVYAGGFSTMESAYGERMATPSILAERVANGRLGVKSRAGFYDFNEEEIAAIRAYRDRAYAGIDRLRHALKASIAGGPGRNGDG